MTSNVKHMILLNLHKSHLFNVWFIQYMKAKNVGVYSLPLTVHMCCSYWMIFMCSKGNTRRRYSFSTLIWLDKNIQAGILDTRTSIWWSFHTRNNRNMFKDTGIYPINLNAEKLQKLGLSQITDKCRSRVVESCLNIMCLYVLSDICWQFKFIFWGEGVEELRQG